MKNPRRLIPILLFFCLTTILLPAAAAEIKGRVQDIHHRPLAGIRVIAGAGGPNTVSAADGSFAIVLAGNLRSLRLTFESSGYYSESREFDPQEMPNEVIVFLTPKDMLKADITVAAPRLDVRLKENPAATTIVNQDVLRSMPRSVAADEALKTVPGVKVDNQADGERVHISIRGQGILTERGIRGIQVLLDGIPLNDASGFAPDLFDVDWATVEQIEVLKGPVAFLYGGSSAGGIINIKTRDGSAAPLAGGFWSSAGSYGFWKTLGEAGGSGKNINFRFSTSRGQGDGYRDHTAFRANNVYGKMHWQPLARLHLTFLLSGTGFFNENAEGLNLAWLAQDRRMANPDALTFNEYQNTKRLTAGVSGEFDLSASQKINFTLYWRSTLYREAVPSSVQHRRYHSPGALLQYVLATGKGPIRNTFSTGVDWEGQTIDDFRYPNLGRAREGSGLLADQNIFQGKVGIFALERLQLGRYWTLQVGLRHDRVRNRLDDYLQANQLDLSGTAAFNKTTGRLGVTWNPCREIGLYASWGLGFLPPATEELYANPAAMGGFNITLLPATSHGAEIGLRGSLSSRFHYDLALFRLDTSNDFERYRITERPLETFYRNAGNSRRFGLETLLQWFPNSDVTFKLAYTYSHFTYSSYDSITYHTELSGHWLPNSPRHQAYADIACRLGRNWLLGISGEIVSKAYVDATNVPSISGYALWNARLAYRWQGRRLRGEVSLSGKNLLNKEYIAFTEPDPDGNSYQPAPTREIFAGLQLWF